MFWAEPRLQTGAGTGLAAEYFADASLGMPVVRRNDAKVDVDSGRGPPVSGLPPDDFSVRWTGKLQAYFSEAVRFYVDADGGVRLWVNGRLLIDSWNEAASERQSTFDPNLAGGARADIRLEYRDTAGDARIKLLWATSGLPKEVIPTLQLFPAGTTPPIADGGPPTGVDARAPAGMDAAPPGEIGGGGCSCRTTTAQAAAGNGAMLPVLLLLFALDRLRLRRARLQSGQSE